VIGVEGANLAQKAAVFVPTILFGIPGAAGQVVVMSLLAYVGMDLGSTAVLNDPDLYETINLSNNFGQKVTRHSLPSTHLPQAVEPEKSANEDLTCNVVLTCGSGN
jgi:hypothetical protein